MDILSLYKVLVKLYFVDYIIIRLEQDIFYNDNAFHVLTTEVKGAQITDKKHY